MENNPPGETPSRAGMAHEGPSRLPTALLVKLLRRVILDCTLDELGKRSKVNPDLISRYEGGKVQPTQRNLEPLLEAAGLVKLQRPLLIAIDQVADALNPGMTFDSSGDPYLLRQLIDSTSRRMTLMRSIDDGPVNSASLLVQFTRKVLLGWSLRQLSARTGIHENVLARYEAGKVDQPSLENLDRVLDAAGVLHLKAAFVPAIVDLAGLLQRPSRFALYGPTAEPRLDKEEIDALIAECLKIGRRKLLEE